MLGLGRPLPRLSGCNLSTWSVRRHEVGPDSVMGHPPFTPEQIEHHRVVMLRAAQNRRARRGKADQFDAPKHLLGPHCCTCQHFHCDKGYAPDADWLRWWLKEIGDGDPFRTLAIDCPAYGRQR